MKIYNFDGFKKLPEGTMYICLDSASNLRVKGSHSETHQEFSAVYPSYDEEDKTNDDFEDLPIGSRCNFGLDFSYVDQVKNYSRFYVLEAEELRALHDAITIAMFNLAEGWGKDENLDLVKLKESVKSTAFLICPECDSNLVDRTTGKCHHCGHVLSRLPED